MFFLSQTRKDYSTTQSKNIFLSFYKYSLQLEGGGGEVIAVEEKGVLRGRKNDSIFIKFCVTI